MLTYFKHTKLSYDYEKISEMSSLERGRGHLYCTIFDWKSRYGTCEHVMNCYFHLQAHVRVFKNACFFNFALHQ